MFAESYKKADATKRGRFNVGEKYVLALCDSATITSTSGQVVFKPNGQRKVGSAKTKVGSIFQGVLSMTDKEWNDVGK